MKLLFGGLLAAGLVVSANAQAADGLKVSATVSRSVRADVLTLTFNSDERRSTDGEQTRDIRKRLENAMSSAGAKIIRLRETYSLPFNTNIKTGQSIGTESAATIHMVKSVVVSMTGFDNPDDILLALSREGIRYFSSVALHSSRADEIKAELDLEAKRAALERALHQARELGLSPAPVLDIVPFNATPAFAVNSGAMMTAESSRTFVADTTNLFSSQTVEGTVTLTSTATVTLGLGQLR